MASKTCLRTFLLIYNVLFWLSGAALIFIGLWMLLEPKRNYILDLVNFSEDDPLLTFASYTAIVCGIFTCFAGFAACCGAIRAERCMILAFIVFILVLFFAELSIGALAILYREKFTGTRMKVYVANMTHNRYNRDKWVTPLLDTIQFYIMSESFKQHLKSLLHKDYGMNMSTYRNHEVTELIDKMQLKCCGIDDKQDWQSSSWRKTKSLHEYETAVFNSEAWRSHRTVKRSIKKSDIVPMTCCKSKNYTLAHFEARNYEGCQRGIHRWINSVQQCCGGSGPMDYEYSFWYITNTERGTRSFVPYSCCKQTQTQDGRAWNLQPIDRMCITYPYFSQAFNNSVHTEGCHAKLQKWFNEQSVIFIIVGFSFAAFQIVGLIISVVYWQKLDNYRYIQAHQ